MAGETPKQEWSRRLRQMARDFLKFLHEWFTRNQPLGDNAGDLVEEMTEYAEQKGALQWYRDHGYDLEGARGVWRGMCWAAGDKHARTFSRTSPQFALSMAVSMLDNVWATEYYTGLRQQQQEKDDEEDK